MTKIERIAEINPEFVIADGFDAAIIGTTKSGVVYSADKCLKILMKRAGMNSEDAEEFFYFNVEGAFVGEYTPVFVWSL